MSAATTAARTRSRGSADATAEPETRTIVVHAPAGGEVGSTALPGAVFDIALNVPLIHQVVVAQLAAARQGTHSTLTRGEVRGGGRKPYRQKGTGRARQGSLRAPQFTGGGIVHGPKPRSYDQRTPKKMKAAALRGALSDRARNNRIHVVSSLVAGETPSTKAAVTALRAIADTRRVLVVAARDDDVTWKSLRNVPAVHLLDPGQLNTYDVLVSDDVVFTQGALVTFLARSQPSLARGVEGGVPVGETEQPGVPESLTRPGHDAEADDDAEAEEEAK
ncbi:50S ribosomal protein L4 [Frankia sp. Cr1]|uniref:50S ribosomal protein L4 n=1 Tax=Frankia sp. Cr1 TaxID=3073931 RepID=UPI002AD26712|nr:50S ribosomal protein L4 [Frankia sp. Cr1]